MTANNRAPATGAITTRQAAGILSGQDPDDGQAGGSNPAGDDADDDAPDVVVEADEDSGPVQPLTAPPFWKAEHKAVFDRLPREAQHIILGHERARVAAAGKVFEHAARMRDQALASNQRAAQLAQTVHAVMQAAPGVDQETVPGVTDPAGRPMSWSQIDWDRAERADPVLAGALRATYSARAQKRSAQLDALVRTAQEAGASAHRHAFSAYVQGESGKLNHLHPALGRDVAKRQAIGRYLLSHGIDPEALRGIGAQELILAEKAMNWDRLNAADAAQSNTQRTPARPGLRPSAAAASAAPKTRAVQEAGDRFATSRSRNDAVALLNART